MLRPPSKILSLSDLLESDESKTDIQFALNLQQEGRLQLFETTGEPILNEEGKPVYQILKATGMVYRQTGSELRPFWPLYAVAEFGNYHSQVASSIGDLTRSANFTVFGYYIAQSQNNNETDPYFTADPALAGEPVFDDKGLPVLITTNDDGTELPMLSLLNRYSYGDRQGRSDRQVTGQDYIRLDPVPSGGMPFETTTIRNDQGVERSSTQPNWKLCSNLEQIALMIITHSKGLEKFAPGISEACKPVEMGGYVSTRANAPSKRANQQNQQAQAGTLAATVVDTIPDISELLGG